MMAAVGVCKVCGAKLNPNVKFCTTCGTATGATPAPTPMPAMTAPTPAMTAPTPVPTPIPTQVPTPVVQKAVAKPVEVRNPKPQEPGLIRLKNNEKIKIEGQEFIIGKKQGLVNYCISDNPTISRIHAKIVNRNGKYYILDMGSTNHTYVNGSQSPANTEIPLVNGTKIRMSNEEFLFQA
jgi:pSer/pThr/pTyr-binding forkhead associated (FHA) protein